MGIRKGFELDENFLNLWNRIKQKTTYRVNYSTDNLIKEAVKAIKEMPETTKPVIRSEKVKVQMVEEGIKTSLTGNDITNIDSLRSEIPDVLGYIQSKTDYTPDWALIFKNDKKLYFVAETKSTHDTNLMRPIEKHKIKCGQRHFDQFPGIKYKQVTKVSELL